KISTLWSIVCHRYVRIMVIGDLAAKIQPQSGAFCFTCGFASDAIEAVKDFFSFPFGYARSLVLYFQLNRGFILFQYCCNRTFTWGVFDSIFKKVVDENL